ncbi:dienelactone hydrolase family protein [Clostridium sp. BJN0013]|uniref:dienelactone hydrolase family protein n=1 Tax=Clostridium sp. BJN0013 TaxID=3236840 RepID=UPI0034C6016F
MITLSNNSDSIIVVLHEIYGINQHIRQVCKYYNQAGFDIICPNLLNLNQAFDYAYEEDAYKYFINNVGFSLASQQVKNLILQVKPKYKHIFILGYSIGATIAWLCSDMEIRCNGIIGYYGSRIRDYLYITPKCKTLLIFPNEEKSFSVNNLLCTIKKKTNVNAYMLSGIHGFSDPFSRNYYDKSYQDAEKLVNDFLTQNK